MGIVCLLESKKGACEKFKSPLEKLQEPGKSPLKKL